jgi:hypothetical protein
VAVVGGEGLGGFVLEQPVDGGQLAQARVAGGHQAGLPCSARWRTCKSSSNMSNTAATRAAMAMPRVRFICSQAQKANQRPTHIDWRRTTSAVRRMVAGDEAPVEQVDDREDDAGGGHHEAGQEGGDNLGVGGVEQQRRVGRAQRRGADQIEAGNVDGPEVVDDVVERQEPEGEEAEAGEQKGEQADTMPESSHRMIIAEMA